MKNITLISSVHNEIGKCNSDELYKIIDQIKPEVVFIELPESLLDKFFKIEFDRHEPLEVKCLKKYSSQNAIKIIPVDIDPRPTLSINQIHYMFESFGNYHIYKTLNEEQSRLVQLSGFKHLNSKMCSDIFLEMKKFEKNLLQFHPQKEILSPIYDLFHAEQNERENQMIKKMFDYSLKNEFENAVFIIGSAHRNSMENKIQNYNVEQTNYINWNFYSS